MSGPWVEKYRPQKLEDIVGQKQIITRLEKYVGEGSMPNLMLQVRQELERPLLHLH